MEKRLYIKPFHLKVNNSVLIENFSLDFEGKRSICLLGESSSGKSYLLATLKRYSPSSIGFYFKEESATENYYKELSYQGREKNAQNLIDSLCRNGQFISYKIALLKVVFSSKPYLFLDDLHHYLTHHEFYDLYSYIQSQNISLFYVTTCIEDCLLFDYLIFIKSHKIAIEGKTLSVLKEEKILKILGYSLPFYVNMSTLLGYYGVLNKICYNKEELERELWK